MTFDALKKETKHTCSYITSVIFIVVLKYLAYESLENA